MEPQVSVVMAAFNAARFVRAAVESLLAQTLEAIEVLVVDDASTDQTADILGSLKDPRLAVLRSARNLGPFGAANRALERARGELVARLDCDDLCAPHRLEVQREHLRAHPEVGLVGSACRLVGEDGADLGVRSFPATDLGIRWACLFGCPFQHSTVMLRRSLLAREGYDGSRRVGGDYDLWARLLRHTRGANLAEPLVGYRRVSTGISATRRPAQLASHLQTALRTVRESFAGLPSDPEAFARLRGWVAGRDPGAPRDPSLAAPLAEIWSAFERAHAGEPGLALLADEVRAQEAALRRGSP
jgi:hypothetical protein